MRQIKIFLIILSGWLVFGLFLTVEMYLFHPSWIVPYDLSEELIYELTLSLVCAVSTPLIFWMSRRFPIERDRWMPRVGLHLGLSIGVSIAACALHGVVMMGLKTPIKEWVLNRIFPSLYYNIDKIMIVYWVILFVDHAFRYSRELKEKEHRELQLESRLAQAQLQALRMQLHPHFLFNTLNAITSLIHKNPDGAEHMIVRLGDLLRTTLDNEGKQFVPLREEAQFLRDYLEIERVRFQDRLTIKFDLPEDTLELPVPFLILQPLVENAIRHGFASSVSHGCIEVIACRENDSLKLIVRDNGAGISPQSANAVHSGVGIANTRARLRQLSASAELHLENGNQRGAQATIVFPISATTE